MRIQIATLLTLILYRFHFVGTLVRPFEFHIRSYLGQTSLNLHSRLVSLYHHKIPTPTKLSKHRRLTSNAPGK